MAKRPESSRGQLDSARGEAFRIISKDGPIPGGGGQGVVLRQTALRAVTARGILARPLFRWFP